MSRRGDYTRSSGLFDFERAAALKEMEELNYEQEDQDSNSPELEQLQARSLQSGHQLSDSLSTHLALFFRGPRQHAPSSNVSRVTTKRAQSPPQTQEPAKKLVVFRDEPRAVAPKKMTPSTARMTAHVAPTNSTAALSARLTAPTIASRAKSVHSTRSPCSSGDEDTPMEHMFKTKSASPTWSSDNSICSSSSGTQSLLLAQLRNISARRSRYLQRLQDLEEEEKRVMATLKESSERNSPTLGGAAKQTMSRAATKYEESPVAPRSSSPRLVPRNTAARVALRNSTPRVGLGDTKPRVAPRDAASQVPLRNSAPRVPSQYTTPRELPRAISQEAPVKKSALVQELRADTPETASRPPVVPVPKKMVRFSLNESTSSTPSIADQKDSGKVQAPSEEKVQKARRARGPLRRSSRFGVSFIDENPEDGGDIWSL